MFKSIFSKIFKLPQKNTQSSSFSTFFRQASSRDKKKVFLYVAKKANEDQFQLIKKIQLAQ